jgi:hypothetical protein
MVPPGTLFWHQAGALSTTARHQAPVPSAGTKHQAPSPKNQAAQFAIYPRLARTRYERSRTSTRIVCHLPSRFPVEGYPMKY